jgi:hypothetical protein
MSDRVTPALLAAMESVFGYKVPVLDTKKVAKKKKKNAGGVRGQEYHARRC